jgi:cell division protein FtsQ
VSKLARVVPAAPRLQARAEAERRERRERLLRRAGWASAGLVPLVLAGWVMLASSLFAVHRVVVRGEHRLTAQQVEAALRVAEGTPLARVDTAAAEKRVRALDAVASVTVVRSWPSTLTVTVLERTAAIAVRDGSHYALLDDHGVEFDTAPSTPRGVMRVAVELSDKPALDAALTVLRALPASLRSRVGLVRATSAQQVRLELYDRKVVIWGSADKTPAKLAAATALLKLPGTVYDVSSPEVVTRR